MFNDDGSRFRYTDLRVRRAQALDVEDVSTFDAWIKSMRHVIGWCQDVQWLIGEYFFHIHPHIYSRALETRTQSGALKANVRSK
jgi:hypothetical protein